jgi:RNA polymerase sigma factor (sigma-70 family)
MSRASTTISPEDSAALPAGDRGDRQLVAAIRRGDDRAFEDLYGRYRRRISAYVAGMVGDSGRAEDVTQEVFISALRRMRETDRPIAFKPWIYEIARNACIDHFRRSRRAEEVSYDADHGLAPADHRRLVHAGPTPEVAVHQREQIDHLRNAFGGLSDSHHRILVLRELEGLSYRQIGEKMGMTRPAVESTLFRARRRLSEEYDELITGARCLQVREIVDAAADGLLGWRERRRMARHLACCQGCRRHAHAAGVDVAGAERRPVRAKIAAWLPLPAFLRERWDLAPRERTGGGGGLAQWSHGLGPMSEPVGSSLVKVAAAAVIALAGVGGAVAARPDGPPPAPQAGVPGSSAAGGITGPGTGSGLTGPPFGASPAGRSGGAATGSSSASRPASSASEKAGSRPGAGAASETGPGSQRGGSAPSSEGTAPAAGAPSSGGGSSPVGRVRETLDGAPRLPSSDPPLPSTGPTTQGALDPVRSPSAPVAPDTRGVQEAVPSPPAPSPPARVAPPSPGSVVGGAVEGVGESTGDVGKRIGAPGLGD